MFELVPIENEMRFEADILVQALKLLVLHGHRVSAQSLICWLRKTPKCEKSDFGEVKVQLEIALTPGRIAARGRYQYSSRVQVTENV
jgi:hypothetical protein